MAGRQDELDCSTAREALSALLDSEPAPAGAEALAAHLASCAPCRAFEAAIGSLTRQLRLRPAELAPQLTPLLTARLRAAQRSRRVGRVARAAAVTLAAAAAPLGALAVTAQPVVHASHATTPCTARLASVRGAGIRDRSRG